MIKLSAGFVVISWLIFVYGSPESREDCAAIRQRCRTLMSTTHFFPWPYPESMREPSDEGYETCRYHNATGRCLRELRTRCPDFDHSTEHDTLREGWYSVVIHEAIGNTCAVFNPMKFLGAHAHCSKQAKTFDPIVEVVLGENMTDFVLAANTEEKAQAALCRKGSEFLRRMGEGRGRTPLRAELVEKCGEDAVNAMEDGFEWTLIHRIIPCPRGQGQGNGTTL